MRRLFVQWPSGCAPLCHRDRHGRGPGRHDGRDRHRYRGRGYRYDRRSNHHDRHTVADPSRDSGSNAATVDSTGAQAGSNAARVGNSAAPSSNARAANSSRVGKNNSPPHLSSKPVQGWNRSRNCSSSNLPRNKVRTQKESNPGTQQEEVGDTWRPPGPRKSHARDAGRRQSKNDLTDETSDIKFGIWCVQATL